MDRGQRKIAAENTLEILKKGSYTVNNKKVSLVKELNQSIEQSILYTEQDSKPFLSEVRDLSNTTKYTCINESAVTRNIKFCKC